MNESTEKTNTMDNKTDTEYGIQELPKPTEALDKKEKYWGDIQTIFTDPGLVVKIINMKPGAQSSLEFHVKKTEYYHILSGRLKVGLRIGRGENRELILEQGQTLEIKPGLMHMRIALESPVTILEWSNTDSDSDSYIVEDGKTYKHHVK